MVFLLKNISEGPTSQVISLVIFMIGILLFLVITTSIGLLVRQYFHRSQMARQLRKSQKYQDILIDCLFFPGESAQSKCILKGKKGKKHIFTSVIYLMHNFTGEYAEKLKTLFYEAGLEIFLIKKLKSRNWWIVAQGLRESRLMGFEKAIPFAEKHINARNIELRGEAQIAIISLKSKNPFEFLNQLIEPFSPWDRIHLFEEISKWEGKLDASIWLKTRHEGVLIFALRIMARWGQKGDPKIVHPLLDHHDPMVRAELIWYAAFCLETRLWKKAAKNYETETTVVRQKLAQTCGMMPDVPLNMLVNWFNHENNTPIKIDLARAMLTHSQNSGLKNRDFDALATVA